MTGLLSPTHVLMLAIIFTMLFGAKRLPEFGKSLGNGIRGFKDAIDGRESDSAPPEQLD